jgi:hypothetical protein
MALLLFTIDRKVNKKGRTRRFNKYMGRPKGSKNKKPRAKAVKQVIEKDYELTEFKIELRNKLNDILLELDCLQDTRPNNELLQDLNAVLGQINFDLLESLS